MSRGANVRFPGNLTAFCHSSIACRMRSTRDTCAALPVPTTHRGFVLTDSRRRSSFNRMRKTDETVRVTVK